MVFTIWMLEMQMHEQHTMRFDGRVEEGPSGRVGRRHARSSGLVFGPSAIRLSGKDELLAAEGASRRQVPVEQRRWGVLRCEQQYRLVFDIHTIPPSRFLLGLQTRDALAITHPIQVLRVLPPHLSIVHQPSVSHARVSDGRLQPVRRQVLALLRQ